MTAMTAPETGRDEAPTPAPARAPRPTFGHSIDGRDVAWSVLVGAVAMLVALLFRSALVPTDPWHYVHGALAFPDGTWRPAGLSRWGFLLPIVPFARLWGDSTATYYVIPLLTTGSLAAVVFLLGTRYVTRLTGVLGTVLALATPLVFVNLTRGYPDLTATMLVAAGILLATLAADAALRAGLTEAGWGWRVPALLAAAGFVTGWSFEVRETAIFAWPVIGWILWRIGRPARTLLWFAPPALVWLVLDIVLCAIVYDDPLLKFRILLGADISSSEVASDASYVGHSRWWYMAVLPRSIWEISGGPAVLAAVAVALVGGVVFRAQLGRLWAWGMLSLGLLWLQGGPLDPEHASVRLDVARYWLSFLVPLLLVAAGTMVIAVRRAVGAWRGAAWVGSGVLTAGLVVPAVMFAATYPGFAPNGGNALSELRDYLARSGGTPDQRIWADWGTQRVLPTYQRGPFGDERWEAANIRSLNRLLRLPAVPSDRYPRPGEYVVVYSADDRTCWHCRRALTDVEEVFGSFPQSGWEEVFTSSTGNLTLYRLGPSVTWPVVGEEQLAPGRDDEGSGANGDDGGDGGTEEPGL